MIKFVNMTPHAVNFILTDGSERTFEPSGNLIRLSQKNEIVGEIDSLPLMKTVFGEPEGLPEFEEGVYYIVSALVKSALPHRSDLLVPSDPVRDDKGRIVGCRAWGI